ncbi:MAG: metalloregulator ArsR/SmtB family transcription factor [Phycisphaerae bacterium]|nr:metalloregulator ArsR/SmtB family transcription factor [Phycisphaerae bacterium]
MARKPPIPFETLRQAADVLRAVAHPLRLRVLELLQDGLERCVKEIQDYLEVRQSAASAQLALMRDRGVLAARRDGMQVFYRVANPAVCQVIDCIRDHRANFAPR